MPTIIDGTNGIDKIAAGAIEFADLPTGSVLQVVQTVSTTLQTFSATSFTELTSLNTSITPKFSTSKILVMLSVTFGTGNDGFPAWRLYRGGTWIDQSATSAPATQTTFGGSVGTGSANAYNQVSVNSFTYLDSPATTSSTTYSIQVSPMRSAARDFALNRATSINDSNQLTGTSTMTLFEVAYA